MNFVRIKFYASRGAERIASIFQNHNLVERLWPGTLTHSGQKNDDVEHGVQLVDFFVFSKNHRSWREISAKVREVR